MKKYLERLSVFKLGLKIVAFFAVRKYDRIVKGLTGTAAWINLKLNKPQKTEDANILAKTWVNLMPPDGQDFFKVDSVEQETAYVEIHLHCPLRDTGDVSACHQLMNYDRKLMENIGANLVVLESQANSGKSYCRLAIRKKGISTNDLTSALLK